MAASTCVESVRWRPRPFRGPRSRARARNLGHSTVGLRNTEIWSILYLSITYELTELGVIGSYWPLPSSSRATVTRPVRDQTPTPIGEHAGACSPVETRPSLTAPRPPARLSCPRLRRIDTDHRLRPRPSSPENSQTGYRGLYQTDPFDTAGCVGSQSDGPARHGLKSGRCEGCRGDPRLGLLRGGLSRERRPGDADPRSHAQDRRGGRSQRPHTINGVIKRKR